MLSAAALTPLLLAAALGEPLDGALGFDFAKAVPDSAIAAAFDAQDSPTLPDNIDFEIFPEDFTTQTGWFFLSPLQLPDTLAAAQPEVLGLLDSQRLPARLVARVDERGCDGLYAWLNSSLQRKYVVAGNAAVPARAPYLQASRYIHGQRQIDVACGPAVLLQYTDLARLTDWRAQQLASHQERRERLEAQQQALALVAEHHNRQFADRFTLGDQARLQGGLGIVFNQPVDLQTLAGEFTADQPLAIELSALPEPFDLGDYQIEVDPERLPIELNGDIPDPAGEHFEQIYQALKTKYGQPVKDTTQHKIFRVNGNFFVLRALPRSGRMQISLLDGAAKREQRARAKAQEAEALAALEEQFRKATDGL